jgi:hypothetical protein
MEIKCQVLVYNYKTEQLEWIDGIITGTRTGYINEDFDRIDVITADGEYIGCHPDCVKEV